VENQLNEDKIVFTNGCFDIIHPGHIEYLKQSRSHGTALIVGLNSDESMRRIKRESYHTQEQRKQVLEAIRYVDKVIIFDEDTPLELIKEVKPYMITKGGDYEPEYVVGRGLALIKIMDTMPGQSSSKILDFLNDKT
tara:strand:- start:760 stop:1170 length:411 start_codon:yes stop_codon:yes gene_type:complete